ncbi:hypothetical protein KYB31_06485 [Clostridium felsineum]|uniref:hypothetical protein n=1 Tax=Clostridium felsineum TaxID=36839 RepID=UPI00214DC2E1|nr:hypothetical protein [Clostridium felsineum]MCR3758641.1 hypothetical protein [Clostridium felsineum]
MSNKITVYINIKDLKAQKDNHYSLYLAKKVENSFTVIWQSKPADDDDDNTYGYQNIFDIDIPSYGVNYTTQKIKKGDVTFQVSGKTIPIEVGQITKLDSMGIFSDAENSTLSPESIVINNELKGNPHEILLDSDKNPIWINTQSGMNIGTATITPKYEYQLWFGNKQETGSLIAENLPNPKIINMEAGQKTIVTYYQGKWIDGEPPKSVIDETNRYILDRI